jgi:hypothetical protein
MGAALVLAVAVVVAAGYGAHRLRAFLLAQVFLVAAWRWLTGDPLNGQPRTDAGWLRRGEGKALTKTGHAHSWWYRPRWQRAAHRSGAASGLVVVAWALIEDFRATVWLLASLTACGLTGAGWQLWLRVTRRQRQRTWLHPLHLAAHELAGVPRAVAASSWITAELDDSGAVRSARLALPAGWPADAKDEQRLVAVAAAKLGIEAPEASWRKAGPAPMLTLTHSEPPPGFYEYGKGELGELLADAVATARPDEWVVGFGKPERGAGRPRVVRASLATDSPHAAVNMGTGGGKSNLVAFWLMQELRRGSVVMMLDSKWWSHAWLYKDAQGEYSYLPNVAYLSSPAQLHAGMVWLGSELDRRNQVARRAVTAAGKLRGDVGPRIVIVGEELNQAMPMVRQHWADTRSSDDPKRSPALTGLGAVAYAGRAVRMHLVLIGQMLTAEVTGSRDSSVKENIGITAMARYGPAGWATAVGKNVPMPPAPSVAGRIQLVTASGVRETQVPLGDLELYRELAMSGTVTPCPAGMPGAVRAGSVPDAPQLSTGGPDMPFVPETPAALGPPPVTLSDAVTQKIVSRSLYALRKASQRQGFPERTGMAGLAALYDPVELAKWDAGARS